MSTTAAVFLDNNNAALYYYIGKLMMAANFDFLKKTDKNLFEIINEAEKLYRDEYFSQCITQTRQFAENVCKNVLGDKRTVEETFDDMLATLKDNSSGEEQEKEFIDDLYFLKKQGNDAVHSSTNNKSGMEALECLQRAFEVAINYAVYNKGAKSDILKLRYDTELLVTGKKSKKSLSEKYEEAKENEEKKTSTKTKKSTGSKRGRKSKKEISVFPISWGIKPKEKPQTKKENKKKKVFTKQSYSMKHKNNKKGLPIFWIIVGISSFISLVVILSMFIASVL